MYRYVLWYFLPIIPSLTSRIWVSWKNRTYRGKFLYYIPIFSSVRTYTKKTVCYVPCKCHNRTFLSPLRLYVPFDCFRRTFLLSFCLYVPYRCHSRTFFSLSCLYVPLSLFTGIFFDLYPLYVPSGSFSRFLCRTEMFRKGKSVYPLISIPKIREIHNSMYYRLRRLLFFGIIRNLFSGRIHI